MTIIKENKNIKLVCVGCGKKIDVKNTKGFMRHPYCKECFEKVFDNNYNKYLHYLIATGQ